MAAFASGIFWLHFWKVGGSGILPLFHYRTCLPTLNRCSFDYNSNFDYQLDSVDHFYLSCVLYSFTASMCWQCILLCLWCCPVWLLFSRYVRSEQHVDQGEWQQVYTWGGGGGGARQTQGDREWVKCAALDYILVLNIYIVTYCICLLCLGR